jgi:PAS domain S-box-containing protein
LATSTTPERDRAFLDWLSPHLPGALELVNVPCYVLDRSGRIRWLNDAAKEMLGDVTGQLYTSLLDPELAHRAHRRFSNQLRGIHQPDVTVDLRGRGKDARVEISSVPLRSGHHAVGVFGLAVPRSDRPRRTVHHDLTPRQTQVLERLADGASTDQIAAEFHLSRETVRNHVRHVLKRLGARSRLEAVAIAHRDGILAAS